MAGQSLYEQELLAKASKYLPGGNGGNTNFPDDLKFLAREGLGSHIWDVSGNEYIDWLMGSGPMILGHAHQAVTQAVLEAVSQGSTFFATNERSVLLAEELCAAVPCAEQVRFTTSGTDACFQCMRAARTFTKKEKILKFEGGFHGTSDYAMMSVTPSTAEEYPQAVSSTLGIPEAIQDLMLIAPFNDLDTTEAIINAHHDEIAAVIIEPIQRIIAPQPGFLNALRDLTNTHGILLIFDEMVTGFRLAYGGAQEFYGVTPDLCSVGKIMGGGYPLAASMGRADIMSVFDQSTTSHGGYVNQIGTLNGDPIGCAAGLATLHELKKAGTYEKLHATGNRLRHGLIEQSNANDIAIQSCGEDAIFDIVFTGQEIKNYRDGLSGNSTLMDRFNAGMLKNGVLKGWPQKFYPSLAHSEEDVTKTLEAFEAVIPTLKQ